MKYYPVGTVVTLVNGNHPIMIYGRKQFQENTDNIWDYVACLYPEGNIGDDYTIFFQQEEIGKVHHLGLMSDAEERMQELLNEVE